MNDFIADSKVIPVVIWPLSIAIEQRNQSQPRNLILIGLDRDQKSTV